MRNLLRSGAIASLAVLGTGVVSAPVTEAAGVPGYTALGSSFAAGPGIPPPQSGAPAACARSAANYPSVLAREGGFGGRFVDASCSGATTANLLTTGQAGQPPQTDQIPADTTLVTVTIGGNDVDYLGSLGAYSCQDSHGSGCATVDTAAIDGTFTGLPGKLRAVVDRIRQKAPRTRVALVNYFTILPESGACDGVPLNSTHLAYERSIADRLAEATANTASITGAALVDLASASRDHNSCSSDPWVEKFIVPAGKSSYHPNTRGMTAAAHLIESAVGIKAG